MFAHKRGEEDQAKVGKCRQEEGGVVSQMCISAWKKKIIATIIVKFTQRIYNLKNEIFSFSR